VPNNAYASYLLLGDGEELPIPEIQNMRDLNKIHLVVLSACETALGETGQDGTEITGLSYYFLEKGAKAVMASCGK
jgi:CHAT domain-containing protein